MLHPASMLIVTEGYSSSSVELVATAFRLYRNKGAAFSCVFEGSDIQEIVRRLW